ncbi:phage tail tape measure protein [Methanocella sp. MCL-LM]|uniref:phage tail tape measure protein n=1 Tax=Methanocella sp. MCL-LM TaxID=3412035 RepID=UPI003C76C709
MVRIRADIKDLQTKLNDAGESLEKNEKAAEKSGKGLQYLSEKATLGAAAIGGVSVGALLLIERSKALDGVLSKSAITMGVETKELRKLVMEMSDATTSSDEAAAAIDALSRAGVKNTADMKTSAKAMLTLGDATGVAADELVLGLSPAFKAFNIPLTDTEKHMDTVNYLIRNTTYTFGEFSGTMEKLAPKTATLGLSFEDTATLLKILSDRGLDSKQAIQAIDQAIETAVPNIEELSKAADKAAKDNAALAVDIDFAERKLGILEDRMKSAKNPTAEMALAIDEQKQKISDLKEKYDENNAVIETYKTKTGDAKISTEDLYTVLGITREEADKYQASMNNAAGATERQAKAANDAKGPTADLKSNIDKLSLSAGEALDPFDSMFVIARDLSGVFLGIIALKGPLTEALKLIGVTGAASAAAVATELTAAYGVLQLLNEGKSAFDKGVGLEWLASDTRGGGQITNEWDPSYKPNTSERFVDKYLAESPPTNTMSGTNRAIPGRAAGGPVNAGEPYIVGERGQELFIPSSNGTIIPNALNNSGGKQEITITVPVYLDTNEIGRALVRHIHVNGVRY